MVTIEDWMDYGDLVQETQEAAAKALDGFEDLRRHMGISGLVEVV